MLITKGSVDMPNTTTNRLSGKTALITGAGRGIGRAIAHAFAGEGAAVMCADIDQQAATAVAAEITGQGGRSAACYCDVSSSTDAQSAVDQTVQNFGALHIVVCNAAVFTPQKTVEELSEDDWNKALAVNVTGAFLICKYAIPQLRAAGGGSIILLASQMGRVANAGQTAYCTTKGALLQLAKGMALDHVKDNIRVNTLSPGGTATDRLVQRFGNLETAQQVWGPKHPMGRLGEPEEIARGALFLASADSSFMTGADLLLDGGYTAW
jgi:NAD(P)-dependent dehydrogenase (short-subunit alcohol dehydrogenase family)